MLRTLAVALLAVSPLAALANNTAGVFGPSITEGHRAIQHRIALTDDDAFAQRLHFESSLNDNLMWRLLAQTRKTMSGRAEFDFVQGELFRELPDINDDWRQGLRFDLRFRDDNRPNQVGLNWTHQFQLPNDWALRAIALTTVQFGDNNRSGVGLQARASFNKRLSRNVGLSVVWFSDYGTTSSLKGSAEQTQQLGPEFTFSNEGRWQLRSGALFGLTRSTPDATFRLWLGRAI